MTSPSLSSDSKIEAGSPKLNEPVPDRSEYQRRCEEALKIARDGLAQEFDGPDSDSKAPEILFARGGALRRITQVLEDR